MRNSLLILSVFLCLPFLGPRCDSELSAQQFRKLAPFSELRWNDANMPEARVEGKWYGAVKINEIEVEDVIQFALQKYGSLRTVKKRFSEDLVEVFWFMRNPFPDEVPLTVELTLKDLKTGELVVFEDIPMTNENRRALWKANGEAEPPENLIRRRVAKPQTISKEMAIEDLNDFKRQLEERFAYLKANEVDYQSELNAIAQKITDPMNVEQLESEIGKVISMFIDGHASPRGISREMKRGERLPFGIDYTDGKFVAFDSEREKFLSEKYPFVTHIDGVKVEEWLDAFDPFVVEGSPQWVRRRSLQNLTYLALGRKRLGLPNKPVVTVRLASYPNRKGRAASFETDLELGRSRIDDLEWDALRSGFLRQNIGYLNLRGGMNDRAVFAIRTQMEEFKNTRGLIVDVRGNTGGSRDPLLELFPFFMQVSEVHIANASKYRKYVDFDPNHLGGSRFMYRESDQRWLDFEREAIESFKVNFKPEWEPTADDFSEWHYLVLSKKETDPQYFYDKPVIVLTDENCFSATDIFVGALKGWRNVTVMGTATGGGSARTVEQLLPFSRIEVRLASMASFQPDGRLYDGNGIEPDIEVSPSPESFLKDGKDSVLEAAIEKLLGE